MLPVCSFCNKKHCIVGAKFAHILAFTFNVTVHFFRAFTLLMSEVIFKQLIKNTFNKVLIYYIEIVVGQIFTYTKLTAWKIPEINVTLRCTCGL